MFEEIIDNFQSYGERFERFIGNIKIGQYGHYRGRVIRRLDQEQYNAKYREYLWLRDRFAQIIQTGDTIDEVFVADLRAAEIELLFETSFFPGGAR